MDLDKIEDIEVLKEYVKKFMVRMKESVYTPKYKFCKGEYYFFEQDDECIYLYLEDGSVGLILTYDEADDYIEGY